MRDKFSFFSNITKLEIIQAHEIHAAAETTVEFAEQ